MVLYTVTGKVGEEGYLDIAKERGSHRQKYICKHDKQMSMQLCVLPEADKKAKRRTILSG